MPTKDAMPTPRELLLERAVKELHWMARRYADGRKTYVTSSLNYLTRDLLAAGVEFEQPDGAPWARDGNGRAYDRLTDEEAALGRGVDPT
mgnify:CR=1 FL=1